MQKKYSFKLNLLLSTFLISSTYSIDNAYSKSYRSGVELPSIEVNFSVIEELKKKEIARKQEEAARLRAVQEAQYAAQQRARQQQIQSQQQIYQQQQAYQQPQQQRGLIDNNANKSSNTYYYRENSQNNQNAVQQQRGYVYKQPQHSQQYNYNRNGVSQYNNQPQYQQYGQQQAPVRQDRQQVINNNVNNQIKQQEYKAHSALPPKTQSQHSQSINDVAESNYEVPYKMVLPKLKPGSELNDVENVDTIVQPLKVEDVAPQQRYVNEIKPGLRDSFIKVTEPSTNNDQGNDKSEPKVSYFKFPKRNKVQEQRIDNDWEDVNDELIDNEEFDFMEMPESISDNRADVSNYDERMRGKLPKVKEVKIYNSESELKEDLKQDKVDTSELNSEVNAEVPVKKESFINVVNKLSNVKKLFSFNDGSEKSEDVVKNNVEQNLDQQSEVKTAIADTTSQASPENELVEEESKALIPVEVNELDEISQNNTPEDDPIKPLKLDGISSIGSITDWRVADGLTASINNRDTKRPVNIASLGNDVSIILPKDVEQESSKQISSENAPLPRIKPIQEELTKKSTVQQIIKKPVIKNVDTNKNEEVSANTDKKVQEEVKTVQIEKKSKEPIIAVKEVKKNDKVVKGDISKKTEAKVAKSEDISKTIAEEQPKRDIKPLSDAQWAQELEKAKRNAVAVEAVEKKEVEVDLSRFKSLLKKEEPEQVATKKLEGVSKDVLKEAKENKASTTEKAKNNLEVSENAEPVKDVVYLEDIAKSLKKNRAPKNNIELSSVNANSSKVTELVGLKMSVPSSEIEPLDKTRLSIANKPSFAGLLKIQFNEDQLELTKNDNERISKLVNSIKGTNKKVEIVSYASSAKLENARRISLKRAIAVRAAMLEAGLPGDKVHVQAAGVAQKKQDENSVNISFVN